MPATPSGWTCCAWHSPIPRQRLLRSAYWRPTRWNESATRRNLGANDGNGEKGQTGRASVHAEENDPAFGELGRYGGNRPHLCKALHQQRVCSASSDYGGG